MNSFIILHENKGRKFTFRLPIIRSADIEVLRGMQGTPLTHMMSENTPQLDTKLGKVQLGSFLYHQVIILF